MKIETLRAVLAVCAAIISVTFCALGTVKVSNDRDIARATERIAMALELARP